MDRSRYSKGSAAASAASASADPAAEPRPNAAPNPSEFTVAESELHLFKELCFGGKKNNQ